MALLTKEQILKAMDLKTQTISIPEWGGEVIIKTMTGTERDEFETGLFETKGNDTKKNVANLRSRLLSYCIVDEKNIRLFSSKDIEALGGKSALALDRMFEVAQKLNGIGAKEVDELSKN